MPEVDPLPQGQVASPSFGQSRALIVRRAMRRKGWAFVGATGERAAYQLPR
jgi:hypothetical protein